MSVTILIKESLLAAVENSIGSRFFQTLYVDEDGEVRDILRAGQESCAIFVSVVLHRFKLLHSPHATIAGLVKDMEESGWGIVHEVQPGDVLIWEAIVQASGQLHQHCGFYMGSDQAISNDYTNGQVPQKHHYTNQLPGRRVIAIYRHPSFANM